MILYGLVSSGKMIDSYKFALTWFSTWTYIIKNYISRSVLINFYHIEMLDFHCFSCLRLVFCYTIPGVQDTPTSSSFLPLEEILWARITFLFGRSQLFATGPVDCMVCGRGEKKLWLLTPSYNSIGWDSDPLNTWTF